MWLSGKRAEITASAKHLRRLMLVQNAAGTVKRSKHGSRGVNERQNEEKVEV